MGQIAAVSRRQVGTLPDDGAGRRQLSDVENAAVPLAVPPSGNAPLEIFWRWCREVNDM